MTPAERKAKIAAAEALLNDVATDEMAPAQASQPMQATTIAAAQAQVAASVKPIIAKVEAAAPAVVAAAVAAAPAITGPGGNTRPTGQPTLLSTMLGLAKLMKGQK